MLKEERFKYILDKLSIQQKVFSIKLSEDLQVSDDTIRRDLHELSKKGLLKKVHGGAVPAAPKSHHAHEWNKRFNYAIQEKKYLAQKALQLFEDGQLILLDGGTTNYQVAQVLPDDLKATIFTNSIPIAAQLVKYPNIELILLGGKILKSYQLAVGTEVIRALDGIRADLCLIGVCSMHYEIGLTIPDWEESQVKRKMVEISKQVAALITSEKIGTAENYLICKCDQLNYLLTDDQSSEASLQIYQDLGIEIL